MPRPRGRAAVWRTLRRLILETGGRQLEALEELEQCDLVAVEMLRYRQAGFSLVQQISRDSTDPESRDEARQAVIQLVYSEGLLNRIATHLNPCLEHVDFSQNATS